MDVSKLLEKAREASERRNYDYAIELYLQACKLDPDNFGARRELRAVENRMTKEKGTSFWGKTKTAGLQTQLPVVFMAKKYDATIEKAEEILKIDPCNVSVLMTLAKAATLAGYKATAVATYEDIIAMNAGGNVKQLIAASRELAHLYEEESKNQEALSVWENVMNRVPGDREATVKYRDLSAKITHTELESRSKGGQRGAAARGMQTTEQAKQAQVLDIEKGEIKSDADLQVVIEATLSEIHKRPDDAQMHGKLGDLYKQGSNYADAKKAYENARLKDPNNYTWLFKQHDLEIWKMLLELKALEPQVRAHDAAAREQYLKLRAQLLELRLSSFLEREKQYSTDSKVKFELGNIYFELAAQKKEKALYDQAITRFQSTYRDPKFRVESGLRLGQGFAAKGQYDLALKRFEETLSGIPEEIKDDRWKNLMYFKADTLHKAGRSADALKSFLEIYEIDVAYRDVAKRVEELGRGTEGGAGQQAIA